RIVSSILKNAVGSDASDIHIEPTEKDLFVRFRVDGVLQKTLTLPKKIQAAVTSRIKILSNMKIDEQRLPQDGRFQIKGDRPVDFRVSTFPTVFGEKVVMRLLDKSQGILTLKQLGLTGRPLEVLEDGIHKAHGMTLVCGPTGSGKTTTLYAILDELNQVGVNIVTLEDPVEYQIPGIYQGQVRSDIGFTFASGLRTIVRQDPDIIMVGEIRDLETAGLAVQAALTGHIVLSTLHTNDAAGAIPRLVDMGVEPFLITSAINAIVAQRLARKICESCKEEVKIDPKTLDEIKKVIADLPEKEKDLILALSKRYVKKAVEDRYPLDLAYSKEMEALFQKYPEDADIGTLYAESIMNLHPWDLFEKDGQPKEWTEPILNTLEQILAKHPEHGGANHFYIHAVESSKTPEKGLTSAEVFDKDLVPNAGHLVHMPSHIYIRTGDYHKGTLSNIRAIAVDSAYVNACNAQGAYPLAYFPHNQHFMAATATLEGNSKWALYAADEVAKNANTQLMKAPEWGTLQHYYTIPFYVYVKFGKWDEILEMTNKVPELDYPQAMLHYARGMAFLGKGQIDKAKAELNSLGILAQNETLKEVTIWNINSVYDLVQIAEKTLRATLLAKEKDFTQSMALLKEAIAIEDDLNYNEPPDWFFSVRHYLGAVQLDAGLNKEAVNTYLKDLENLPKNGWALHGLTAAYAGLKDDVDRKAAEEKFKAAWATADVELTGSKIK
ncbi:MAG: hypothetical protein E4H26_03230, partial [Flavobacteriales bacterium]